MKLGAILIAALASFSIATPVGSRDNIVTFFGKGLKECTILASYAANNTDEELLEKYFGYVDLRLIPICFYILNPTRTSRSARNVPKQLHDIAQHCLSMRIALFENPVR